MTLPPHLQSHAQTYVQDPRTAARQWFAEAKFGLFMHYGLYALHGKGDWGMYNQAMPLAEYERLADRFTAEHFDADFITDLAAGLQPADQHCSLARWLDPRGRCGDAARGRPPHPRRRDRRVHEALYLAYVCQQRGVTDGHHKLIKYHVNDQRHTQLFNLVDDPWETQNLAGDPAHGKTLTRLGGQLTHLRDQCQDTQPKLGEPFWAGLRS